MNIRKIILKILNVQFVQLFYYKKNFELENYNKGEIEWKMKILK